MTNNLSKVLKKEGKTAYWMAKKLNVSNSAAYAYVRAKNLHPTTMRKIAEALEVDVNKIFEL